MPASSLSTGISAGVCIALVGLILLTRKVARGRAHAPQPKPQAAFCGAMSYKVGLLEIAIPRKGSKGGAFRRVMVNDACMTSAIKGVSQKLLVGLREVEGIPPGEVRAYVSDLYCQLWDVACTGNRPHLDFRVLFPPEGRGTGVTRPFPSLQDTELLADVEVLYSDVPRDVNELNSLREAAGVPTLELVDLTKVAQVSYNEGYFYLEDTEGDIPLFENVACGGTFDRLHGGHRKLLTAAASFCQGTLTVGVTSDEMLKSKANHNLVASLQDRIDAVKDFLRSTDPNLRTRVEEIRDPFGPPAVEVAFDAIVVSSETVRGADKINELRRDRGMPTLKVIVTRRTAAATLSSSYLREAHAHG